MNGKRFLYMKIRMERVNIENWPLSDLDFQ
jgi:hypothetical protein